MKPEVRLTDVDGNVFMIIGTVRKALQRAGLNDEAEEFTKKAHNAESYDKVLQLCMEYCEVS